MSRPATKNKGQAFGACPRVSPTVLEEEEEPTGLLQRNNSRSLRPRLE
jgi:hypothetical protein